MNPQRRAHIEKVIRTTWKSGPQYVAEVEALRSENKSLRRAIHDAWFGLLLELGDEHPIMRGLSDSYSLIGATVVVGGEAQKEPK